MQYLIKGYSYLKITDLGRALKPIFPDKYVQKSVVQLIRGVSEEFQLHLEKRHPVILIVDDVSLFEKNNFLDNFFISDFRLFSLGNDGNF